MRNLSLALFLTALAAPAFAGPADDYRTFCADCHGPNRLGAQGPALLPEFLARIPVDKVIAAGRPATQMAGFSDRLTPDRITTLAQWIKTEPLETPSWGMSEITASHNVLADQNTLPANPPFSSDPLNLFLVVEAGDHHVTILDGDRMVPLYRLASHFALHGGAKYSPDGRFVYLASRDGWVSKIDMWTGTLLAEVRVAVNTRNIAVSDDGRFVLAGNGLPGGLVILDAFGLAPVRIIPTPGRVSAVYAAPPRHSFVVALKDSPELWEIPASTLTPRKITLEDRLDDFYFDPAYQRVLGSARDGTVGHVIDLDSGHKIAELPFSGMPHLGSGITFVWHGRPVMATPHLKDGVVSVVAMDDWSEIKRIPTCGAGFFLRGHEMVKTAWVDCSASADHKDTLQLIDLETLEVTASLRPSPGHTAGHVEFTRDGKRALVSVMEDDGALVVYDTTTLAEVARLPMRKPIGKYNVYNKITLSPGTSH